MLASSDRVAASSPPRCPRRSPAPIDADPAAKVYGLTGRSLSNRPRAMAAAAGLEGAFSGHSGRAGIGPVARYYNR